MPRMRSPPRSHSMRKRPSYLAIMYHSDSRRSSFSDSMSDFKGSPDITKELEVEIKSESPPLYRIKIERPSTPQLSLIKSKLIKHYEFTCNANVAAKEKLKAEDEIKSETESNYEPEADVKYYKLDSHGQSIEAYEPASDRNEHFEGPWFKLQAMFHKARWYRISRLVIITPDSLELPLNGPVVLPLCKSFHLDSCHPADILKFKLPMVDYLGLVTRDVSDPKYAEEIEQLIACPTFGQMRPIQLCLALPAGDLTFSILFDLLGKEATTIKAVLGPDSYMGDTLFDALAMPSQRSTEAAPIPELLPYAKCVMFDMTHCAGYNKLACETAGEKLRVAAEARSRWAGEPVEMSLI